MTRTCPKMKKKLNSKKSKKVLSRKCSTSLIANESCELSFGWDSVGFESDLSNSKFDVFMNYFKAVGFEMWALIILFNICNKACIPNFNSETQLTISWPEKVLRGVLYYKTEVKWRRFITCMICMKTLL